MVAVHTQVSAISIILPVILIGLVVTVVIIIARAIRKKKKRDDTNMNLFQDTEDK